MKTKKRNKKLAIKMSLITCVIMISANVFGQSAPYGVVLMKADDIHINHDKLVSKELAYYGWRRGPYIENKYSAYRFLLSAATVGWFDPFSKRKYESVLQHFNDSTFEKGAAHDFGSDVYHVGNMAGLGSPMFKAADDWVTLPHFDKTDSIIVDILDSSSASPKYRVSYYGWAIDSTQKIDVELEVSTTWEERFIHCQLKVTGFAGSVGAGLQHIEGVPAVKDAEAATIYNQGIFPGGEMLQAVHVAPEFFNSFETDDQGEVMVLKNSSTGVMKWSFLHSWSNEPNPLYNEENWQSKLSH